jgi:hypothetical protein
MTQAALSSRAAVSEPVPGSITGRHFELLMRHPVINAGITIAAWHHYRLPRISSIDPSQMSMNQSDYE